MTVFYKNDKIKISGDWNQGYCGEIPESYMEIPFPEEYKRFLRKHNGGNFLVEFENERVPHQLVLFDIDTVLKRKWLRQYPNLGAEWSFNNIDHGVYGCSNLYHSYIKDSYLTPYGFFEIDARSIYKFFYDTHILIGFYDTWEYEEYRVVFAVNKYSEYMIADNFSIEPLVPVKISTPAVIDGTRYDTGLYVPDYGILIPGINRNHDYVLKKFEEVQAEPLGRSFSDLQWPNDAAVRHKTLFTLTKYFLKSIETGEI